jgi:hypothetical protein
VTVHTVNTILCGILRHLEFNQVAKNPLTFATRSFTAVSIYLISRLNTDDSDSGCFRAVQYIQMQSLSYGVSLTECVATRCPSVELILFPHHPMWPRDDNTSPLVRIFAQSSFPPSGLNYAITAHPTAHRLVTPLSQVVFRTSRAIEHKVPLGAKLWQNNSLLILSSNWLEQVTGTLQQWKLLDTIGH